MQLGLEMLVDAFKLTDFLFTEQETTLILFLSFKHQFDLSFQEIVVLFYVSIFFKNNLFQPLQICLILGERWMQRIRLISLMLTHIYV
jgi:hypothetical protein